MITTNHSTLPEETAGTHYPPHRISGIIETTRKTKESSSTPGYRLTIALDGIDEHTYRRNEDVVTICSQPCTGRIPHHRDGDPPYFYVHLYRTIAKISARHPTDPVFPAYLISMGHIARCRSIHPCPMGHLPIDACATILSFPTLCDTS